eukprot:comp17555_c1_seq1/m.17152 comp17555_c1_seq1/g.17152  ORF comp17555_c1_seq1/g.17152 comp17555_c1_seq1/m.17152 type:complete len:727 (-) comp17555_c1_seq1:413-2593(-)
MQIVDEEWDDDDDRQARRRGKRRAPRRSRKYSVGTDTDDDDDDAMKPFVVEVTVLLGRAPIYFNHEGTAYMRRDGGLAIMDSATVSARISHAWEATRIATTGAVPRTEEDFIGREKDIDDICAFVYTCKENTKVVALHGRPGVGKSSLAYRLVGDFRSIYPHGEYVINLKGPAGKGYLPVEDAMGLVIRTKWPDKHVNRKEPVSLRTQYLSCFQQRRCILVIENAGDSKMVVPLLPRPHECLVIVTSRQDLGLELLNSAVVSKRLQELSPEDGVQLLRFYQPAISQSDAQALCASCGYLPLGIRLLGGILLKRPNTTPAALLKKLEGSERRAELAELLGVPEALELLPEGEMEALRMLSVIPGRFDGSAAAAVMGMTYEETEDTLGSMIEGGLFEFDMVTRTYWQNDLLREYVCHNYQKENPEAWRQCTQRFIVFYANLLELLGSPGSDDSNLLVQSFRTNFEAAFNRSFNFPSEETANASSRLAARLFIFRFCLPEPFRQRIKDYMRENPAAMDLVPIHTQSIPTPPITCECEIDANVNPSLRLANSPRVPTSPSLRSNQSDSSAGNQIGKMLNGFAQDPAVKRKVAPPRLTVASSSADPENSKTPLGSEDERTPTHSGPPNENSFVPLIFSPRTSRRFRHGDTMEEDSDDRLKISDAISDNFSISESEIAERVPDSSADEEVEGEIIVIQSPRLANRPAASAVPLEDALDRLDINPDASVGPSQ